MNCVTKLFQKIKKLRLFNCNYLQWAALYVNKNTITGKTYLNTTFVY